MDIIFGRLAPGQRLIEDELMARFSQSRHRMRCAIDTLTARGLARREKNCGAHVCRYTGTQIRQMYDLRHILHEAALRQIPLPVSAENIATLRRLHHGHIAASQAGDLEAVFLFNNRFHNALFGCCNNAVLAEAIDFRAVATYPIRTHPFAQQGYLAQVQREHEQMIHALEQGALDALIALTRTHIERPMHDYLAKYNLSAQTPA